MILLYMAANTYEGNKTHINRDVTNMLNRYNNQRIEAWDEGNNPDFWRDNVNHNLELDGLPDYFMNDLIVSNEGYGYEKMYTLQFDLNPWYVHFSGFRRIGKENCSCYLFIFWKYTVYPDHPEERVVYSRPNGGWIIKNPKTSEHMIIQMLAEQEAFIDDEVNFPMIPVAEHRELSASYPSDIFEFLGINERGPNAAKGDIVSLQELSALTGYQDILTLGSGNPLLNEDIILFHTPLFVQTPYFWLKNSLIVNFRRSGMNGRQRLKEYLYGLTTAEKTINQQRLRVDDTRLNSDVLDSILKFGGKKKRRSLKKNKKSKRRKLLKKKQRKTKRKGRR